MPIYKRCSRCGKRLPSGTTCSCQIAGRRAGYREYDRQQRDQKSKQFYDSQLWERARAAALEADGGFDVYAYMTDGRILAADTVHHIIPVKDAWEKRLDIDNLMSLSGNTHSAIEQLYRKDKAGAIRMLQQLLKEYRELKGRGGLKSF